MNGSSSPAPTIMYRKPENSQNHHTNRTGRSHYEPLYSNRQLSTEPPMTNLHRLSQGADYYGSDNSDR